MASLRELKTVWQIRFYDSRRDPKRTTNSIPKSDYTRAEAEEEAEWRQQLYDRGEYDPWVQDRPGELIEAEHVTVSDAIDRYITDKTEAGKRGERRGWAEGTAQRYKPVLRAFARSVGSSRLLHHLTADDIRGYVYRGDLTDSTKRTYYGMISAWTSWLEDQGLPAPSMPPEIQTTQTLPAWCSRDQLATIIRAFEHMCREDAEANDDPAMTFERSIHDNTRWSITHMWRFAFWQALRKSEIVAIRCGGVDLEDRQMVVGDEHFVPKSRSEDVIPLSEPAARIAEEWGAGSRPPDERLFKRESAERVSRYFSDARTRAIEDDSLPDEARLDETASDLTLHSLRHGRAIDLIRKRRHIVYVSQFLRHGSLEITRRYLQVVPRHLHDEIRELNEEGLDL